MSTDSTRRGRITDEHKAEAARLKALWVREQPRLRASGLGTQEAFGDRFKIGNQAAVGFFLNGRTALSPKAAAGFARGLRCEVSDFSPRLAELLQSAAPQPVGEPLSELALQVAALADQIPTEAQRQALLSLARSLAVPNAKTGAALPDTKPGKRTGTGG